MTPPSSARTYKSNRSIALSSALTKSWDSDRARATKACASCPAEPSAIYFEIGLWPRLDSGVIHAYRDWFSLHVEVELAVVQLRPGVVLKTAQGKML